MDTDLLVKGVRKELKSHYNQKQAGIIKRYMVTRLSTYGVKAPVMRQIAKRFSKGRRYDEAIPLINSLLGSANFEEVCVGLYMLGDYNKELADDEANLWGFLESFINKVDNWCHSDYSCQIRNMLLQKNPSRIKELKKWVSSKNSWKRRAALITLVRWSKGYKVTASKKDAMEIVDALVLDKDYYVRKAVGWILRELSVKYPDEIFGYIKRKNILLSAVTRATAMEKLRKKGYSLQ